MPTPKNIKNLSKEDILFLYNYVIRFESDIRDNYGKYDFESTSLDRFCKLNQIKKKGRIDSKGENQFWFTAKKLKGQSVNDVAHHLLRHIRNSISHALVTKKGKYYFLEDYNQNATQTMGGKIRMDLLPSFIDEIIGTKKSI